MIQSIAKLGVTLNYFISDYKPPERRIMTGTAHSSGCRVGAQ